MKINDADTQEKKDKDVVLELIKSDHEDLKKRDPSGSELNWENTRTTDYLHTVVDPKKIEGTDIFEETDTVCLFMDTVYDGCPMMYFFVLGSGNILLVQELQKDNGLPKKYWNDKDLSIYKTIIGPAVKVSMADVARSKLGQITVMDLYRGNGELGIKGELAQINQNGSVKKLKSKTSIIPMLQSCIGDKMTLADLWEGVPIESLYRAAMLFKENQDKKKNGAKS